ncbi:MAG: hypothetical protein HY429_04440 [Candidatus Levybacteria bacterium]|nr:hypothetical protein [Candidatus Levybacteria bacterium]
MREKIRAIIKRYQIGKTKLLIALLLLTAIVATVYLVQRQQIFRSGAYVNEQAFEVKNDRNEQLTCNGGVCQTDTLRVRIKLTDPNRLSQ